MAEYGTTLEEKLKDFEDSVLFKHTEKRQATVVGIVGAGGIGKTTLTKEFFKRRRSDYAGSSFLSDVRENAARGNVTSLQSKLLRDLQGNRDIKIGSLDEGKAILVKNLESCHALIVLDDVNHVDQLEALTPMKHLLDPKSLILVTTRFYDALKSIPKIIIYVAKSMSREASRGLFCSYAFSQSCPPQGFERAVEVFLDICKGVPLLLKAFGGLLCGENDLCKWEEVLVRLRSIPPVKIQHALQICYNSLAEEEQEIFLDIACFSIGKDRDTWIGIWDASGWKGLVGFQNLMNKGLVEVDNENKIVMHDHLKELGRNMVRDKAPRRFWRATIEQLSYGIKQLCGIRMYPVMHDSLKELGRDLVRDSTIEDLREQLSSGITQVRGIRMYPVMHDSLKELGRDLVRDKVLHDSLKELGRDSTIDDLLEQSLSRITQVHGIAMYSDRMYPDDTRMYPVHPRMYPDDTRMYPDDTRMYSDIMYPDDTIVGSLEPLGMMGNLHFLEAEGSVVESILTRVRSPKLMWLHWINCPHSSLPPWLRMHDLRVLEVAGKELKILWKCESQAPMHLRELIVDAPLSKFPKSLEQLKHLKMIEAKEAYLATLPEEFCYLPFLKYIKLKDYQILPDSDGNFSNIQLTDGRNQESISDSMDNLKNLNLTDLERCTSLEMLLTAIVWRHFQSP